MGELTTLARPYAVAAYKRAKETGATHQWGEALSFLTTVMEDEQMAKAAANPKSDRKQFTAAFLDLCRGYLEVEAENFVRLLIQYHRLGLVRYIAELYQQYKAEDEGYVDVDLRSAYPLADDEVSLLTSALGNALRTTVNLRMTVDPSLIGGVYLRAGDRVVDYSIRGQIERMAQSLRN
jgi:F-type H+-transporting ATPase subunit delta